MNQNTVLIDKMERVPKNQNDEQAGEISLSTINGQRSLLPEVSHLITSVDRLTSQNFALLKMASVSGNDIGMG